MASEDVKSAPAKTESSTPPSKETPKEASPAPKLWTPDQGSNLEVIVRGGTTSSRYDMEQAQRIAETEARRKQLDADRKIGTTPIEQGGGMMFDHNFSDPLQSPKVLLHYHSSDLDFHMLCELIADDNSEDVILQFVCPQCVKRGVPHGDAQCTVRDSHRKWHLDTRAAGRIMYAETVDMSGRPIREPYMSAGVIKDTDILRCSNHNCGWAYKIDDNRLHDYR